MVDAIIVAATAVAVCFFGGLLLTITTYYCGRIWQAREGRRRFPRVVLATLGLLALFAADASACNRCGLFGNRCRFVSQRHYSPVKYVAPVVQHVHNPPDVTNFVFNNTFPTPYLQADQGSSVFGYSLAAKAYSFDPNQYLDRSARLQELSIENQKLGQDGANQIAGLALETQREFNQTFANTAAFNALLAANAGGGGASIQSYRVTVQGGELKVEKIDVEGGGGDAGGGLGDELPAIDPFPGGLSALSCFKCHAGKNEDATKAARIDPLVAVTGDERKAMILAVNTGRMPPKTNLTEEQKAEVIAGLCQIPSK